jgi:hypothetical protein
MRKWPSLAVFLIVLGGTPLLAQRMGFSVGPRQGFTSAPRAPGWTISFHGTPAGSFQRFPIFPQSFYSSPFFYSDYNLPPPANQVGTPTPQVIVIQPDSDLERPKSRAERPTQMLLLERRGDHFVRVGEADSERDSGQPASRYAQSPARKPSFESASSQHHKLPPAVLVFRDGRREEIDSYTIADGMLYASSNYWDSGVWIKRLPLTSLNLPATLRENEARGSRFALPSGPHEVTLRP